MSKTSHHSRNSNQCLKGRKISLLASPKRTTREKEQNATLFKPGITLKQNKMRKLEEKQAGILKDIQYKSNKKLTSPMSLPMLELNKDLPDAIRKKSSDISVNKAIASKISSNNDQEEKEETEKPETTDQIIPIIVTRSTKSPLNENSRFRQVTRIPLKPGGFSAFPVKESLPTVTFVNGSPRSILTSNSKGKTSRKVPKIFRFNKLLSPTRNSQIRSCNRIRRAAINTSRPLTFMPSVKKTRPGDYFQILRINSKGEEQIDSQLQEPTSPLNPQSLAETVKIQQKCARFLSYKPLSREPETSRLKKMHLSP